MMKHLPLFTLTLWLTLGVYAWAVPAQKGESPCKKIKAACEAAGFVKGAAKDGNGLWRHCIDPLVKGTPQPKGATKPLPTVDASLIEACKAQHGAGKKK